MLSREDNELVTQVGPGTALGKLFRRYWIPALLCEEIPTPDCPPVRVRLLGEDLVAFRDSQGRVGLLDELCSHRRASLFFARNEECGLRCVYHGWKYDVEGNVLETPAEPPGSQLRFKVHHTAYPCRETAGMIFAYMGPKAEMPVFQDFRMADDTLAEHRPGQVFSGVQLSPGSGRNLRSLPLFFPAPGKRQVSSQPALGIGSPVLRHHRNALRDQDRGHQGSRA